jgi:CheY-like chemotaxis protein
MKVLAVEDDKASLAILCRSLERLGHEVIGTEDGEEAWKAWLKEKPRVVVSDWQMPKLDGLKLCRLRAQQGQEYVYFILLTGAGATGQNRRAAAEAGVDDFLTKPIDMSRTLDAPACRRADPQLHDFQVLPPGGDDADVLLLQEDQG